MYYLVVTVTATFGEVIIMLFNSDVIIKLRFKKLGNFPQTSQLLDGRVGLQSRLEWFQTPYFPPFYIQLSEGSNCYKSPFYEYSQCLPAYLIGLTFLSLCSQSDCVPFSCEMLVEGPFKPSLFQGTHPCSFLEWRNPSALATVAPSS